MTMTLNELEANLEFSSGEVIDQEFEMEVIIDNLCGRGVGRGCHLQPTVCVISVSYTHLDVYKRQVYKHTHTHTSGMARLFLWGVIDQCFCEGVTDDKG